MRQEQRVTDSMTPSSRHCDTSTANTSTAPSPHLPTTPLPYLPADGQTHSCRPSSPGTTTGASSAHEDLMPTRPRRLSRLPSRCSISSKRANRNSHWRIPILSLAYTHPLIDVYPSSHWRIPILPLTYTHRVSNVYSSRQ